MKVLIVGAGFGGLALAAYLLRQRSALWKSNNREFLSEEQQQGVSVTLSDGSQQKFDLVPPVLLLKGMEDILEIQA